MPDIKRITAKEFRELGLLQEVNRRVLHPCGLALEVVINEETGEEVFGGVWDYRDDPEGLIYGEGVLNPDKAAAVDQLVAEKEDVRRERFGYVVQPVRE